MDEIERARLSELERLRALDLPMTPSLQRLCELAQDIFGVPASLVSILDADTQWIKASAGPSLPPTPRSSTFCDHTIRSDDVLVVSDAREDHRFASSPLVMQEGGIRFYAGAPLVVEPGVRLGALCLIDHAPRRLSENEIRILRKLAEAAAEELRRHKADLDADTERRELARVSAERSRLDEDVRNQRHLLLQSENASTSGSWEVDLRTGAVTWSRGLYELIGADPDEAQDLIERFRRSTHIEDMPQLDEALTAIDSARPFSVEFRITDASGKTRLISSRGGPMNDAAGEPQRMIGILCDVSELKSAQAALKESEDHHRNAVELSPQIPWIADPAGRFIEVSPRWFEATGMTAEASSGNSWALAIHPSDRDASISSWRLSLRTAAPFDIQFRLCGPCGGYRWVRAFAAPRLATDGSVLRWYGTIEDIDDRKQAEEALRQSESFARSVLDSSPDFVLVADLDGRVLSLNRKAKTSLGADGAERLLGQSWAASWPIETRATIERAVDRARNGFSQQFSERCPRQDEHQSWLNVSVDPVRDADGKTTHILAIARDVTEQRRLHEEVEVSRVQLATVLNSTVDSVVVLDRNWRITYLNEQAERFICMAQPVQTGDNLFELYPEQMDELRPRYEEAFETGRTMKFETFIVRNQRWVEVSVCPLRDLLSIFFRDITEARQARVELDRLAYEDPLTGLSNRARFNQALDLALSATPSQDVAVHLLDLDLFKEVNDTLGHPAGDAILRQVADRLRTVVGNEGVLARLGGDEFAVIQSPAFAYRGLAERLCNCFEDPFLADGNVLRLSASVGVAVSTDLPEVDAKQMHRAADIALYRAKLEGRGVARVFDVAMLDRVQARQSMKRDLELALEREELRLVYQPILNICSARIIGVEALLRWQHAKLGNISPTEFIPLAEDTGLIVPIGEWVLETACRQAVLWPKTLTVAVNVSAVQLRGDAFPLKVASVLSRTGLDPARLELEITESVLLHDNEHNMRLLHALKDLGVRIALDDFGTGFSSLSYLRLFPFDKLKLDRAFVQDIGKSPESEAIVRAAGEMGRALSMVTTAEGVETEAQLQWLRSSGWAQAQGYHIGRPCSATDMQAILDRSASGLRALNSLAGAAG